MRVLIVSNNYFGLYSFRKEVVNAIRDYGHEVFISAPFDEKMSYFKGIGCVLFDTHFDRKGTNPIKDARLFLSYCKLLRNVRPDVVLSYTIKPNLYVGMACQLNRVPQIANITGLGSAVENPGCLQALTICLYRLGLRKTKYVFFQNKANMTFFESRRMINGRHGLIPGSGVNLQFHSLQQYPEDGIIKFVFISRLLREKGIEEYLNAARRIKETYHNTEFHVVGPCEDQYEDILDKFQSKGIIVYHGQQTDVRPFIGSSHCTIHPSYYPEGMSNVLLETCAAGRPIITTNRPGCGEVVEDGKTGFIVKERDTNDLVRVIIRFLSLSYLQKKQMGLEARKKVEREFDRRIVVDSYLNIIDEISKP